MTLHPNDLPAYLASNPRLVKDQNFTEARMFSLVLSAQFCYNMLEPAWYIMSVENSMIHKCASLAGPPWLIATLLILTGLAMLPKIFIDLCMPKKRSCRLPRQIATCSAIIASVIWALMGNLARPLDAGALHLIYWTNAIGYMGLAAVYAISLNVQQINETSAPSQ